MSKIGRNEPCPCGSGKKHKKCCLLNSITPSSVSVEFNWRKIRKTDDKLNNLIFKYFIKEYPDPELLEFAWEEYYAFDEETPEIDMGSPEFICGFMPWLLFNWTPDRENNEIETDLSVTIAESYLCRHGHRLNRFEKDFIVENMKSQFSYYEVLSVNPGQSLRVRDILRNREIVVYEKAGSQSADVGYILMCRVLTLSGCSVFVGTHPHVIPAEFSISAVALKQHFKDGDFNNEDLFILDLEIRGLFLKALEAYRSRKLPKLVNTDGDDMAPSKLFFNLNCSTDAAFEKLATLSAAVAAPDELMDDVTYGEDGKINKINFPWFVPGNKMHKSWDNTIFAHMELSDSKLVVEINSVERANKAKEKINNLMGDMIEYETMLIESIDSKINEAPNNNEDHQININDNPEMKEMLKEMHDRHWKDWLDMNIPALNNQTPRHAAKTQNGRERLEALFSDFHQKNLKITASNNKNQLPIDLCFLREELEMT